MNSEYQTPHPDPHIFIRVLTYMGAVALLIYSHCLIRFNISSENNDFGFNSIQKINFSKNFTYNAIRSKFDLDVKYVKVNLGSSFEQTW